MSTVIIAVILISVIAAICVILISINNKDREKTTLKLLDHFTGIAMQSNLSFSSQEILETALIGLDGIQRKLLVITKTGADEYDSLLIDLKEVKSCNKKKLYKNVNVGGTEKIKLEKQIDKIVLDFEFADGRPSVQITFFEPLTNHILTMSELEKKAGNWEAMLSKLIHLELKKTG
jgi:hypothetical protein